MPSPASFGFPSVPFSTDVSDWISFVPHLAAALLLVTTVWGVLDVRRSRWAFAAEVSRALGSAPRARLDLAPATVWTPPTPDVTAILALGAAFPRGENARVRRASAIDPRTGGKLLPGDAVSGELGWSLVAGDDGATLIVVEPSRQRAWSRLPGVLVSIACVLGRPRNRR